MTPGTFAVVPLEVIADRRLSLIETRVLIALFSFRSKDADTVWPTRAAIRERCGYADHVISQATRKLVDLGWLSKTGKGGHGMATRYRITVPESGTVPEQGTVPGSGKEPFPDRDLNPSRIGNTEYTKKRSEQTNRSKAKVKAFFEDQFWPAYPRKVKRKEALDVMLKVKPDDATQKQIMEALEVQKRSEDWNRDGGQFVPHPTTWLRKERWTDEIHHKPTGGAVHNFPGVDTPPGVGAWK